MAFRPDRLIERMEVMKLKQTDLAEQIGVSDRMIRDYRAGRGVPGGEHLARLAEALETTVSYLMGQTDDPFPNLHLSENERRFILWLRSLGHEPTIEDTAEYFASQDVPRNRPPRAKR